MPLSNLSAEQLDAMLAVLEQKRAGPWEMAARCSLAATGVLLSLCLIQWLLGAADREQLEHLKASQTEKQVWMEDQMGVSEAIIKGMVEVNAQLKARGMVGIDSFVKTAKENQEHARSIVDKSRHVRR